MSDLSPRFSVVIPNYNNAGTLARAIESVLAQSWAAHEIIVIDDGSSDESKSVIEQFGARVRSVFQVNAGVSAARNSGVALATGDWLAFLDADDCYLPNRLQVHADWILREPGIDFLMGDQEFRKPDGEFLHMAISHCGSGRRLVKKHPGQVHIPMYHADFEEFIADGFGEIRALSLPRATFLALGGFPLGKKIGEDLHFVIRLCAASAKAGVVNLPLAIYYIYPTSVLRTNILRAQQGFVETLASLDGELTSARPAIRHGCREKLRRARLDLAYTYLRGGQRLNAIRSVLPVALASPGLRSLRDLLSVVKGLPPQQKG